MLAAVLTQDEDVKENGMISREDLCNSLLLLVPGAKFSFWPDDNREATWVDDKVDYFRRDGWCIAWMKENNQTCPELSSIKSITQETLAAYITKRDKQDSVDHYSKDLNMISNFEIEKKTNPALSFGDYIDQLKVKQKSLLADIAASKQPV